MALRLNRRDLLRLGTGTAGMLLGGAAAASARSPGALASPAAVRGLEELALALRTTARDRVPDLLARAIASGADRTAVLGAVFAAGLREIPPRPVGSELHAVMMVESVFRMTDDAAAQSTWLAALWAADDFKEAQAREVRRHGTDWALPERPRLLERGDAESELVLALEGFDPERADRAVATLAEDGRHDRALEIIRPFAPRSFTDAGHRVVFVAQVERALRRLGPRLAGPALRSLALGLADDAPGEATSAYEASRALAAELAPLEAGDDWDPARSLEVLAALRGLSPEDSRKAVRDALVGGIGPRLLWDGLRLYAAELMLLRPERGRAFPVHTVTELEALGYVWMRTRDETTRRWLLLQAAAWLALVRDAVVGNNGAYDEGAGIDRLGEEVEKPDLGRGLERRSPELVCAALERAPGLGARYVAGLADALAQRADQNHQYKLAAATLEESARVHPRWRARILAPAVDYVPGPGERRTCERSLRALRAAGVLG